MLLNVLLWCSRCFRGCVFTWSSVSDRSTLTCTCSRAWRMGVWCVPFCLPLKPDNHPLVSKHICCYPVNETGKFFQKRSHLCWSVCRSDDMDGPVEDIGSRSCVTRFVKTLLSIMEHGVKPHSKHLTEYFAFLYEFAKMGEEEVTTTYLFIYLSIY